ncbi:uncharacterized protein THITE_118025 [Thermothielavioides terrestris NRRL 8126]|uniref:Uncharacterized protein n=1 Tax=Thermothielavioides terrestris (strain ATCC 38088 / NRRL 8126) TaxID=578455 RepID=G2R664_THETT|nr:uncharacterized protein THITE_118025 [Thermothielavioides terrestris NRRL 8126]AEO67601.1 hypothetical protein THITE_118025 [Thermothielavioides terrestris NRRL 8126]
MTATIVMTAILIYCSYNTLFQYLKYCKDAKNIKEASALEANDGIDSPLGNYTHLYIAVYTKEDRASRSIIGYNLLNLLDHSIERYKGKYRRYYRALIDYNVKKVDL